MKDFIQERIFDFSELLYSIEATNFSGDVLKIEQAVEKVLSQMSLVEKRNAGFFFVGNGGSAAMASHMIPDFVKTCGIKAFNFSDPALMTCMANDYGYENVFSEPVKKFMSKDDILIAISSSGDSLNIVNAVREARKKSCFIITLSGFDRKNKIRRRGDVNFYAPSNSYCFVESAHEFILHHFFIDFFNLFEFEKENK